MQKPKWSWQQAILESALPPTTRHVLLTLATYMNSHGDNCFPSHQTIAKNTGLTVRSVITHIQVAVDAGFLVKEKRNLPGRVWDANEYYPSFPIVGEGVNVIHPSQEIDISSESNALNTLSTGSYDENNATQNQGVNVIHPSQEIELRGETGSLEGCTTFTRGVKDVHTNRPLNSPMNLPEKNILKKVSEKNYPDGFENFFNSWPENKRCKKKQAYEHYLDALKVIHHTQLMECVGRYLQTQEVKKDLANYPGKWLKDRRWLEVMDKSAPLTAPALTLNDIGGDTPDNRDFLGILEKIRMQVGDASFQSWFKALRLAHKNCTVIKFSVPMDFTRLRLESNYQSIIHNATTDIWPEIKTIEIVTRGK